MKYEQEKMMNMDIKSRSHATAVKQVRQGRTTAYLPLPFLFSFIINNDVVMIVIVIQQYYILLVFHDTFIFKVIMTPFVLCQTKVHYFHWHYKIHCNITWSYL